VVIQQGGTARSQHSYRPGSCLRVFAQVRTRAEGGWMESREECLKEAAECDRLAGLANTEGTRRIMMVVAFKWRKLAEKAADRGKAYTSSASEAIQPRC
jgi:hypothetical protein